MVCGYVMVAYGSADASVAILTHKHYTLETPLYSMLYFQLIVRSLNKTLDIKCDCHFQGLYRMKVNRCATGQKKTSLTHTHSNTVGRFKYHV